MASELQLNKQGLESDVLAAVQQAETRNDNSPVHIVNVWQNIELSSNVHSTKFKIALLTLYKQGELLADESMSLFSADFRHRRGP